MKREDVLQLKSNIDQEISKLDEIMLPYRNEQEKLQIKIKELQEKCTHQYATKVAGANTGNYCSQDDSYWYHINCPDCGYSKMYLDQQLWNGYMYALRQYNFSLSDDDLKILKEQYLKEQS